MGDGAQAESAAQRALLLIEERAALHQSTPVRAGVAVNLATARLHKGDLDGAAEALEIVWAVPGDQRVTGLLERTSRLRHALTAPAYRGAAAAATLGERLEDFQRTSAQGAVGRDVRSALEG